MGPLADLGGLNAAHVARNTATRRTASDKE